MKHFSLDDLGIAPGLVAQLRSHAANAEKSGCLTPAQLEVIYEKRWFNLFVPAALGGLDLSLPHGVLLEEGLAYIDGSLGWTVTLCAGAAQFVGYLQPTVASKIFDQRRACFAGSGRTGIASIVANGYEVNGCWPWATGAPHATIFTANCFIEQDGRRQKNKDGTDTIQSFFFLRSEVTINEHWPMMGLRATAGHTFEVKQLSVGQERRFLIDAAHATQAGQIYQYPFLQFASATIAANTSGMALHFMDLCQDLVAGKTAASSINSTRHFAQELEHAKATLHGLRTAFYSALQASWYLHGEGATECGKSLDAVMGASRNLARDARALVQALYPHCGMAGANSSTEINRIWRDIHTASQHGLLNGYE